MLKSKFTLFYVTLCLGIILVVMSILFFNNQKNVAQISSSGLSFENIITYVEVADTDEERAKGLMNRKELCEKCGMLFVFEKPKIQSFWMKNTLIPLDIIFIEESGRISNIAENTEPQNQIKTYTSKTETKYVLEVNAGITAKYNIKEGDIINISKLLEFAQPYDFVLKENTEFSI